MLGFRPQENGNNSREFNCCELSSQPHEAPTQTPRFLPQGQQIRKRQAVRSPQQAKGIPVREGRQRQRVGEQVPDGGRTLAFDLGGRENLTEAQQQLIRRCAMISAECERLESQAVEGQPLNALAYGQLTGHLVRALNVLGIKRELRDVTPALHQYLDALQAPVEFPDPAATTEAAETPDSAAAADEKD